MKLHVYVLFNNYLGCADNPQFSPVGPKDTIEGYRRQILNDPETAHKYHTQEKEVRYIGLFDDLTGKIELFPEQQRLVELRGFFPAGYLDKKAADKAAIEKKALDDYLAMQKEVLLGGSNKA